MALLQGSSPSQDSAYSPFPPKSSHFPSCTLQAPPSLRPSCNGIQHRLSPNLQPLGVQTCVLRPVPNSCGSSGIILLEAFPSDAAWVLPFAEQLRQSSAGGGMPLPPETWERIACPWKGGAGTAGSKEGSGGELRACFHHGCADAQKLCPQPCSLLPTPARCRGARTHRWCTWG